MIRLRRVTCPAGLLRDLFGSYRNLQRNNLQRFLLYGPKKYIRPFYIIQTGFRAINTQNLSKLLI